MKPLIDKTYFWGELSLPVSTTELSLWIDKYQADYLEKMVGDKYLECPTVLSAYLVDADRKISLIANYVYVMYQNNNVSVTTFSGERTQTVANTAVVDDRVKRQTAWNKMVDLNQRVHQKLYTLGTIPNEAVFINYLNDILYNLNLRYDIIVLQNRTQNIRLFGGIFSNKYSEDFPK